MALAATRKIGPAGRRGFRIQHLVRHGRLEKNSYFVKEGEHNLKDRPNRAVFLDIELNPKRWYHINNMGKLRNSYLLTEETFKLLIKGLIGQRLLLTGTALGYFAKLKLKVRE